MFGRKKNTYCTWKKSKTWTDRYDISCSKEFKPREVVIICPYCNRRIELVNEDGTKKVMYDF